MDKIPISEARANLSDLAASVRLLRRCVLLTHRGKPRIGVVPPELAQAISDAGGADAALLVLNATPPATGQPTA